MSWFDWVRRFLSLSAVLALAGCFQPLYNEQINPGLVQAMKEIEVAPIPDRIGHYLSDNLISRMNGTGQKFPPQYRLVVTLSQTVQTPTIESQVQAADAATVVGIARFDLIKLDTEKVIFSGSASATAVYDRTLQSFANLRAGRDAEIRVARSLADEIELRLAGALAKAK